MNELVKEIRDVKLKVNSLLSKKHNHLCLFSGCSLQSISSHSISKSTLKLIAKDSCVIHPQFDRARFNEEEIYGKDTNLLFKEIGLDRAGTFKGFCNEHDNGFFSNIDNRGIKTKRDIFLQLYRTAHKFLFTDIQHNKAELEVLGYEYHSNTEYNDNLVINFEKIISLCEDLLVDFPELDCPISIKSSETLTIKPFSDKENPDIDILYKKIKPVIPVALQNSFILSFNEEHSASLVIVTPDSDYTNLIILCSPKITPKYTDCINSDIKVLNFIESILMLDSEFYLSPDVFEKWNTGKVKTIENDYYFFNERSFLEEYDLSIFDDIRKHLCLKLPEEERVKELKKIYNNPERDSVENRNQKQMFETIKDRHKKLLHTGNTTGASYPIGSLRII